MALDRAAVHLRNEPAVLGYGLVSVMNMTDRELLELAAKAAGITVIRSRLEDPACRDLLIDAESKEGQRYSGWNPLTDDGDALRLAVTLHIDLRINNGAAETIWIDEAISETHSIKVPCYESFEGMPAKYAATRRAIVMAASEIGKAMP